MLAEVDPATASAYTSQAPIAQLPVEPVADVVMYCTPWCPHCQQAREYLKQHNIVYTEVNINRDRMAVQRVRDWADGNEITPTFNIRGQIIINFDRAKLDEVLGVNLKENLSDSAFSWCGFHHESYCMNVEKLIDIQPQGNVNFCIDFPDYTFGNVKEATIQEIWNSDRARRFRKYRRKHLLAVCYRCGAKYMSEIEG